MISDWNPTSRLHNSSSVLSSPVLVTKNPDHFSSYIVSLKYGTFQNRIISVIVWSCKEWPSKALGSKFSHFLIFESSFEPSLHLPALDYFFVPGASGLRLLCWPLMKLQILRSVREFFIFLKFLSVHFLITPFVSVTPSQREQVEVQQRVGSKTY